jgi:hypothetical protein
MFVEGEEKWMSLREAAVTYDNGFVRVEMGTLVIDDEGGTTPDHGCRTTQISDLADEISASR